MFPWQRSCPSIIKMVNFQNFLFVKYENEEKYAQYSHQALTAHLSCFSDNKCRWELNWPGRLMSVGEGETTPWADRQACLVCIDMTMTFHPAPPLMLSGSSTGDVDGGSSLGLWQLRQTTKITCRLIFQWLVLWLPYCCKPLAHGGFGLLWHFFLWCATSA